MSFPDDRYSIPSHGAKRILVAGATGRFGGIAELLLSRGHTVRAASRDPAHPAALRLAAAGAEVVRADFEDATSLAEAAHGMDAVFASGTAHRAGPDGEERHGKNLADALTWGDGQHLVFVSGAGADRAAGLPLLAAKGAVEQRIRDLRLRATVLAPVYLMENLINPWNRAALRAGVLPTPIPPALRLQQVATRDLLALAVLTLECPEAFAGARIEIASDAPTGAEAATALSGVLGRRFVATQVPGEDLPPGLAALFAWLERDAPVVDISAVRERFPGIAWQGFGSWAGDHRAELGAG